MFGLSLLNLIHPLLSNKSKENESYVSSEMKQTYNPNKFDSTGLLHIGKPNVNDGHGINIGTPTENGTEHINIPLVPEFQSGTILVGKELRLMKAIHNERDMLEKAGLHIDPTDDLRIIMNSNGKVVGAIAFGTKHVNQIKKIRYIDVDRDSINFNKCMCHIIRNTEHSSNPLRFYNADDVQIDRDHIKQDYII